MADAPTIPEANQRWRPGSEAKAQAVLSRRARRVLSLAHRDADVAAARAAAAERVPMVLSNQASRSMEECVAVMGDSPRWFQLYWSTVDELVESFLARAEACRCDAIVVTLDTTLLGWRPRDLDLGSLPFAHGLGIAQYTSDPVFTRLVEQRARGGQRDGRQQRPTAAALRALLSIARTYPGRTWSNLRSPLPRAAVETFLDIYSRPSITWRDLGGSGTTPGCRSSSRASCIRTMPAVRLTMAWTGSSSAHTADDRSMEGSVPSTRCRRWFPRWPAPCPSCSTAAFAAARTW